MVHFLKQLVESIYRPAYWYQLIRHRAAKRLPAGTGARSCDAALEKVRAEVMATESTSCFDDQGEEGSYNVIES